MIDRKSWQEFRDAGLLWWINRIIHVFGWAIVYEYDNKEELTAVYPARVKFRGFSGDCETDGFIQVSEYMKKNAEQLLREAKE